MSSQIYAWQAKLYMEIKKYTDSLKLPRLLAQNQWQVSLFYFPSFYSLLYDCSRSSFTIAETKVETFTPEYHI